MIFNGIEKDYIKVNNDLYRPPTPPIEFETRAVRSGGARKQSKRFTDMMLPVPITVRSDVPVELLKEEIAAWLYHEEPKKLVFKQVPERHYLAEYESVELVERGGYAKGVINFYLAQGYRFGPDMSISLTDTYQTRLIGGQVKTPWKSITTFTGSQAKYTLENNQGGIIELNYTFVKGDVLVVDYDKRKVTLNGNNLAVAISLSTHWFDLNPGVRQLRASHPTTMNYEERYY